MPIVGVECRAKSSCWVRAHARQRCFECVIHRISYNAGVVNYFFRTPLHPLKEERHFALFEKLAIPTRLARNQFSGQHSRSDPCVSSVTTAIMITTSDSSLRRSGMLNQLLGVLPAHHG